MDFKMFGGGVISLSRLMDSNNCFSQIIADDHLSLAWC